jgi:hypothetical protein
LGHALKSKGRLSAIENAATRALFFDQQSAREVCFADIERAMIEAGTIDAPPAARETGADASRLEWHSSQCKRAEACREQDQPTLASGKRSFKTHPEFPNKDNFGCAG